MSYTGAQLRDIYTKTHLGLAPTASAGVVLDTLAAQNAGGGVTDAQTLLAVVDTADADTAVAISAYQFFTAKAPTQAGLAYLVNSATNPTDLNDPYYGQFNQANRYINFAQNLGILGDGATFFAAAYGGLTFAQAVAAFYESIIGAAQATAAGISPAAAVADIAARLPYFTAIAAERFTGLNQDLAIKAALVGYIMSESMKANVGKFAVATENMLLAVGSDTAIYNTDILSTYGSGAPPVTPGTPVVTPPPVTGSFASTAPASATNVVVDLSAAVTQTGLAANPGSTIAVGHATNALTMTLTDTTGGADVVSVTLATNGAAVAGVLPGVTAKLISAGVENLNVTSSGALAGAAASTNVLNLDPTVDTFTRIDIYGSAPLAIHLGAYTVSAVLSGGGATGELVLDAGAVAAAAVAVSINGGSANDTITPVHLAGASGASALLYGGGGGDLFNLGAHTEHDTLLYKLGSDSTLDTTNTSGASGTTTANTGKMDVVNGFVSGQDKIDLTLFNFSATQAQLIDKGTAADATALATLAATATFYQSAGITRALAQVHIGGDNFLFVDTNKDGFYSSADLVVKLMGVGLLANADILH